MTPRAGDWEEAADFAQVTEATMRAIALASAQRPVTEPGTDLNTPPLQDARDLRVELVPSPTTTLLAARGDADFRALWRGHHNAETHAARAPTSIVACALFDAAERARIEAYGTRYLLGTARNIAAAHERHADEMNYAQSEGQDPATLPDAFEYLVREALSTASPPSSARDMVESWRGPLGTGLEGARVALRDAIQDQARYAELVLQLVRELDVRQRVPRAPTASAERPNDSQTGISLDNITLDEIAEPPVTDDVVPEEAPSAETGAELAQQLPYRVYCRDFDEVIAAERLSSVSELAGLRARLDSSDSVGRSQLIRSSRWLQRRLSTRLHGHWEGGRDEGVLDPGSLARALTNLARPLVYRQLRDARHIDTTVTLLLDVSNSMRGRRATLAALCADQLGFVLDRVGIATEILGYTTRAWKGGRSHERWVEEGSPSNPGRLTDLRHIVFKSAATPYRRARRSLGLVLQRGLLKENVDGEALLWAHRRLTSRSELRRILVVVCDGAPSDEATLSSNYEQYLNDHLRTVIKSIETRSIVELMGIGICHDISGLYRCSTSVGRVDDLGPTLMQMVGTALEP
jgi:cobaltochelatase CobT